MAIDLTGIFQGGPGAKGEDFYKQFPFLRPPAPPEESLMRYATAPKPTQPPTLPMTQNAQGVWEPTGPAPTTGADLSGLAPLRQASRQTLANAYDPGGGVDQQALQDLINRQLWGTGESAGVYSGMASRGLNELQPETQYATSRVVKDSLQQLADQYAARQRAAIETGRTTEMTEPNFRLTEAGVTGAYGGQPTLENLLGTRALDIRGEEAATRSKQLEEELSFRRQALLGSMIGGLAERSGLLDLIFGGRAGTAGGGLLGTATGAATRGLLPQAVRWIGEQLGFGSDIAAYTPQQRAIIDSMTRQDAMVESMNMGQGGGGGGGAGGAVGGAASGVGAANTVSGMAGGPTIQGLLAGVGALTPGGVGAAAPSIEAGLVEMLGPELAAELGYGAGATAGGAAGGAAGGGGAGAGAAGATPLAAWALPVAAIGLPVAAGLSAGYANKKLMGAEYGAKMAFQGQMAKNPQIGQTLLANFQDEVNRAIAADVDVYPGDVMTRAIQRTGIPTTNDVYTAGISQVLTGEQPYAQVWAQLHDWLRQKAYSIYANPAWDMDLGK